MGLCEIKFEQKYFSNKEKQWCTFNKVSPPLCSQVWCLLHITKNIVFISQITLKDKLYHQRVSYKKLCLTFSISTSKLELEGLIFLVCPPNTSTWCILKTFGRLFQVIVKARKMDAGMKRLQCSTATSKYYYFENG